MGVFYMSTELTKLNQEYQDIMHDDGKGIGYYLSGGLNFVLGGFIPGYDGVLDKFGVLPSFSTSENTILETKQNKLSALDTKIDLALMKNSREFETKAFMDLKSQINNHPTLKNKIKLSGLTDGFDLDAKLESIKPRVFNTEVIDGRDYYSVGNEYVGVNLMFDGGPTHKKRLDSSIMDAFEYVRNAPDYFNTKYSEYGEMATNLNNLKNIIGTTKDILNITSNT